MANWTKKNGICIPNNAAALAKAKELQNQLNRLGAKLAVDGRLGSKTVSAVASVTGMRYPECLGVANNIDLVTMTVKGIANNKGAPARVVPPAPTRPPLTAKSDGSIVDPAPPTFLDNFTQNPIMMVGAGLGALLAFNYFKKGR